MKAVVEMHLQESDICRSNPSDHSHFHELSGPFPQLLRCAMLVALKTCSWLWLAPTGVGEVVQELKMSKVDTLFHCHNDR